MDPNHCPDALQLDSGLMTAVAARCEEGTRGSGTLRTQSTGPAVWPAFVAEISHLRLGGLFAFPIQIGVLLVGTLELYRQEAGPLSRGELAAALDTGEALAGGRARDRSLLRD